jgi:hypothetical protein
MYSRWPYGHPQKATESYGKLRKGTERYRKVRKGTERYRKVRKPTFFDLKISACQHIPNFCFPLFAFCFSEFQRFSFFPQFPHSALYALRSAFYSLNFPPFRSLTVAHGRLQSVANQAPQSVMVGYGRLRSPLFFQPTLHSELTTPNSNQASLFLKRSNAIHVTLQKCRVAEKQ